MEDLFTFETEIPTQVWDMFAEPNNYKLSRVKPTDKNRPHLRTFGVLAQKAG